MDTAAHDARGRRPATEMETIMGFSRDFDGVRITDNGQSLRVEATSLLGGVPSTGDPATAIRVSLVALPGFDVTLTSEPVDVPVGDQWHADFPNATSYLGDTRTVYVIGCADDPELDEPYTWGESHHVYEVAHANLVGPPLRVLDGDELPPEASSDGPDGTP